MSGICGVVVTRGIAGSARRGVDLALLETMTEALRHRGPDDAGFLLAGNCGMRNAECGMRIAECGSGTYNLQSALRNPQFAEVGLGIRRLAVSDPEGGHQPIGNEEGTVWVILDGVIANARELRRALTWRGHRFATHAEAEVIVHAYEESGREGLARLRGQFAFALWDDRRRLLLLARDPSGVRTLFLTEAAGQFRFASEAKALLRDPGVSRAVDGEAARHYLASGTLPPTRSLFREVRALPPGAMLALREGRERIETPWEAASLSGALAADALEPAEAWGVVRQTVAAYLASDLPGDSAGCGLFLDGSTASAALALAARELLGSPLPTFSLAGGRLAGRVRRLARGLGAEHREIPPAMGPAGLWPQLLWRLDAPPSDLAPLDAFLLCRGARDQMTVALLEGAESAALAGAFGLEGRAPFRDEVFLRYAGGEAGVPVVLQRALAGRVSRRLLAHPAAGQERDSGGLAPLADRLLTPDLVRMRGLTDPESVATLRARQRRGDPDAARRLQALLLLELWHRIYVDRDLSGRDDLTLADLGLAPLGAPAARARCSVLGARLGAFRVEGTPASTWYAAPGTCPHGARPSTEHRAPSTRAKRAGGSLSILLATEADPAAPTTGAARLAREWSARLAARGHHVTVLTGQEAGAADFEYLDGFEIVRTAVRGEQPGERYHAAVREGARALKRLARERGIDVALLDHPAGAAALRRARLTSRALPLYLFRAPWGHDTPESAGDRRWREREERAAIRGCRGVIVPSRFSAARFAACHRELGLPVTLLAGGVDAARFRPRGERWELRRRLGLPESAFLLLTLGPLRPGRGVENLVTAMAGIAAAYPEAHLVIGGEGPLESALVRQIGDQRLGDAVTIAGHLPEELLPEYYAAADLFVMPATRPEPCGLAVLEAMACGTPVLATPVGVLPELVTHLDPRALIADPGAGAIADAVIRHLPDLHHDETLRRRCRHLALEHFDWEVLISQLEAHLRESLAPRPAAPPPAPWGLIPRWPCFE